MNEGCDWNWHQESPGTHANFGIEALTCQKRVSYRLGTAGTGRPFDAHCGAALIRPTLMLPEQPKRVLHPAEKRLRLRSIAAARLSARDQFPQPRYLLFGVEDAVITLCHHSPDERPRRFIPLPSVAPFPSARPVS